MAQFVRNVRRTVDNSLKVVGIVYTRLESLSPNAPARSGMAVYQPGTGSERVRRRMAPAGQDYLARSVYGIGGRSEGVAERPDFRG